MKPVIAEPREELSKYAPQIVTTQIKVEKIKAFYKEMYEANG